LDPGACGDGSGLFTAWIAITGWQIGINFSPATPPQGIQNAEVDTVASMYVFIPKRDSYVLGVGATKTLQSAATVSEATPLIRFPPFRYS
jgi:hypothetical protein